MLTLGSIRQVDTSIREDQSIPSPVYIVVASLEIVHGTLCVEDAANLPFSQDAT
jgi:hypothetical protein